MPASGVLPDVMVGELQCAVADSLPVVLPCSGNPAVVGELLVAAGSSWVAAGPGGRAGIIKVLLLLAAVNESVF